MEQKLIHLSLEERIEIQNLTQKGSPLYKIAEHLSRSPSCIREELKRCPKNQYDAHIAQRQYSDSWEKRRTKFKKPFSEQEINLIKEMMREGSTKSTIRRKLGCSFQKIERWFLENKPTYKGGELASLYKRIEAIEQQLEIVIDILRSKK